MRTISCDVAVVGAGPAGSSAARAAALGGVDAVLVDQRNNVGLPVQCAEYVPRLLMREVDVDRRCIVQEVEAMRTHLPDGQVSDIRSPGYILDRALFDRSLATTAIEEGVRFLNRTRVTSVDEKGIWAQRGEERIRIDARVVIGGDGPRSQVGKAVGQVNAGFVQAMQYQVALQSGSTATQVFFDRGYAGGYAWLFPKGCTANVGVGVSAGLRHGSIREILDAFLETLVASGTVKPNGILGSTGGEIPVGGYLNTVVGNALLVGDAAGQTDPVTGAGVTQAAICGQMAGEVAAQAVRRKSRLHLEEYERRWKALFGTALDWALRKRKLMESGWEASDLCSLIRRCWVGFKEYRA